MTPQQPVQALVPWWRVGTAWFGVSALVAVMIGSFALLYTAIQHRDGVIEQVEVPVHSVPNEADSPALQARNHAATPR